AMALEALASAEASRKAVRLVARVPRRVGEACDWRVIPCGLEAADAADFAVAVGGLPGEVVAAIASEAARLVKCGEDAWFVTTIGTRVEIVIVGSGHVAQPLAIMASYLGYRVVVVDDRPEYTTRQRFPEA